VSAGVKAGDTVIVEEAMFPESEHFVGQEGEVVGVNSYDGEIYVDMGGKYWITARRVRLTAR
jgi:ribosomal protein L24